MRSLILGVLVSLLTTPALALSGATDDDADRFPFVVEVNRDGKLMCSGTVLFPRLVVTAAHCIQKKVYWRGGIEYVDEFLDSQSLTVSVTDHGEAKTYRVTKVEASPDWRRVIKDSESTDRFIHDVALLVIEEPIVVGSPPSLLMVSQEAAQAGKPRYYADDRPWEASDAQIEPVGPLNGEALLVAFGADSCRPFGPCDNAGVRRYQPVGIKQANDCFRNRYTRPSHPSLSPAAGGDLPPAVWCMESLVFPGDSGGALFMEDGDGTLYFIGVISAQQGLPPALAAVQRHKRSVASALYPSLGFITEAARKLGYMP